MDHLLNEYYEWLGERLSVRCVGSEAVITTPYLGPFNDYIQVFGDQISDEEWRLTDDGETLFNLQASGVDLTTEKRGELFNRAINRFGVSYSDPELFVKANGQDFAWQLHSLVQAILAVGDLLYTAQPHVKSIFLQEVEEWFSELGISAVSGSSFEGESGLTHRFDFVIPQNFETGTRERILDAVSAPTKQKIERVMFSWQDVQPTRDARMYALLNDTDQDLPHDKAQALKRYDITPVRWSHRSDFAEELAA